MKAIHNLFSFSALTLALLLGGCSDQPASTSTGTTGAAGEATESAGADYPRGAHNGRLLRDGDVALELAIFETGVPPEFHAWPLRNGSAVPLGEVDLTVTLTRLGNEQDVIRFAPEGDYLRGDAVVYEPHSFSVLVEARIGNETHRWTYDSFEGRTTITPAMKSALGIETAVAGPAVLQQTFLTTGRIVPNQDYTHSMTARFDGMVKEVRVSLGDQVIAGQTLMVVESNESLKPYNITTPIAGIVSARHANAGEQTAGRVLLEIMDPSRIWAELAVFPADRQLVQPGTAVSVALANGSEARQGSIAGFSTLVGANQAYTARVSLDNSDGRFVPGAFVSATIDSGAINVPLAVRREGLQPFRDFTVVFAKVGNEYEVRMLELGRQDAEMIEVLGGLRAGTEYVTTNSYILKADVEKSGASHDH